MALKSSIRKFAAELAARRGLAIIPRHLAYDWQLNPSQAPSHSNAVLSAEAAAYLQPNNPFLRELEKRYAAADAKVTTPEIWKAGYVTTEDLRYFRGDNAYRWVLRGRDRSFVSYVVSTYYLKSVDRLGLLDVLDEDEAFGELTFRIDDRIVSNDLLDSVSELNFLERHLRISEKKALKILDIGAGYGRLAHRAARGLPNLASYLCADAVAVSSFLCDFYLRERGVDDKAKVIFLDQIKMTRDLNDVDIAVNVHSFSECRVDAIDWWISEAAKRNIKNLFIVPNCANSGDSRLGTNDGTDFSDVLVRHGYKLRVKEPKYVRPEVQELGFNPSYYFLFERS